MLNSRWIGPKCRNPPVSSRHHSPFATAPGTRAHSSNSGARAFSPMLPDVTTVQANTATFSASSTGVTSGRPPGGAPAMVTPRRAPWWPSATQSTHWAPTAASRRHCGQAGPPQRVQVSAVARSGCRTQTVGAASEGVEKPPRAAAGGTRLLDTLPEGGPPGSGGVGGPAAWDTSVRELDPLDD